MSNPIVNTNMHSDLGQHSVGWSKSSTSSVNYHTNVFMITTSDTQRRVEKETKSWKMIVGDACSLVKIG